MKRYTIVRSLTQTESVSYTVDAESPESALYLVENDEVEDNGDFYYEDHGDLEYSIESEEDIDEE
jgi:hypothetical protein